MRGRAIMVVVAAALSLHVDRAEGRDVQAPAPKLILRGQHLMLDARVGAVTASVEAEALQDGGKEDTIQVRNLYSGRVQSARVTRPGRAEVLR